MESSASDVGHMQALKVIGLSLTVVIPLLAALYVL